MLAALALAAVLGAADPCTAMQGGLAFDTCFDPGNRLALGAGTSSAGPLLVEGGLRLRRSRESRSHELVSWSTEHALGEAELVRNARGWRGEALAYDGLFLRHLDEGFLLLPTRTPLRVPFPFDIAVEARLGEVERDAAQRERLEVGRAGLFLDAARDPTGTRRLALGPSLSYALEREPGGPTRALVQPLTGATLLVRAETGDGLWAAQARADAGWELQPRGPSQLRAEAHGTLERVLLAVDDQPVSLQLSARALARSGVPGEVRVGLALVAACEL